MTFRKTTYFNTNFITLITVSVAMIISIVALAGWIFHLDILTTFLPGWNSMVANTALGIILSGISLLLYTSGKNNRLAAIMALIVFLLGAISLCENLFGWNTNIDELFFKDTKTPVDMHPGLMAPATAFIFIMIGISLLTYPGNKKIILRISKIAVTVPFFIAFISFTGYLYGARELYDIRGFQSIAFTTALAVMFLTIGIFFSKPDFGILSEFNKPTIAARTGFRIAVFFVLFLVGISWVRIQGEYAGLYNTRFGLSMMVIVFIVSFLFVIWYWVRKLNLAEEEKEDLFRLKEESENNLMQLMNNSSGMIASIDREHRLIIYNKAGADEYRLYSGKEMEPGIIHYKIFSPEVQAVWKSKIDEALNGSTVNFERIYEIGGSEKYAEIFLYPIKKANVITGVTCFIMDITQRKKAQQALIESEQYLRAIFESEPECIKLLGPGGELLDMNPAGLAMIEADNLEMVKGKSVLGIITPKYRDTFSSLTQNVFNGESGILEFEITGLKGTSRWLETHAVPLKDNGGKVISLLSVTSDITESKMVKEEIKKAIERYELIGKATNDAVWEWNMQTGEKWGNESFYQLYGLNRQSDNINDLQFYSRTHPEDIPKLESLLADALEQKAQSLVMEFRFRMPDNTYKTFFDRAFIHYDDSGKPVRLIGAMQDITERKKAEEKLKKSIERFEMIALTTNDGLWEWNFETGELWANQMLQHLYGLSIADPVPQMEQWAQKIHPDDRERIIAAQQESLSSDKKVWISEYRFETKDKGFIDIYDRTYVVRNEAGNPIRIMGSMMDITERKKAEQQIRESEERYRSLVDQASDGILVADLQGNIIEGNSALCSMFGYSSEEILKKNVTFFIDPEELKLVPLRLDLLYSDRSVLLERKALHKNGTRFNIELNSKLISEGIILSIIRDVSERKKVQNLIFKEKQLSNEIIDSIPGIFFLRDNYNFLRWNKQFESISGYTSAEISKMDPVRTFFDKEEIEKINEKENQVIKNGSSMLEATPRVKDGRKIPFYFSTRRINFEGRDCIIGTGIDISERKKTEKELEESYQAIRKLTEHLQNIREEERTYIAREIHDELGQQITVMMMDVAWLDKKISSENKQATEKIKELMEMLVGTVKSVRRISSELRPSVLDDIGLEAAIELHLHEFEKRSGIHTLFTKLKTEMKLTDPVKNALFRIFQESVTNIARHSSAKTVTVNLGKKNKKIILKITDDGIGYDENKAAAKKNLGVLGMKERAAGIGGEYHISGRPGKGTHILVSVPFQD